MKLCIYRVLFLSLVCQSLSVLAEEGSPLEKSKSVYAESLKKIELEHQAKIKPLNDAYYKSLMKILDKAKADGDLKALIACKEEEKRFLKVQTVPSTSRPGVHPLIEKAQVSYNGALMDAGKERDKKTLSLLAHYVKRLEALKVAYVRKEDIANATAVAKVLDGAKEEYQRIRKLIPTGKSSPSRVLVQKTDSSSTVHKGLILHYPFDVDRRSIVADRSGSRLNGKSVETQWTRDGKRGGGLLFQGHGYIVTDLGRHADFDEKSFTISFWANPFDRTSCGFMGKKRDFKAHQNLSIDMVYGKLIGLRFHADDLLVDDVLLPLNEWSLITVSFDHNTLERTLYLNGGILKQKNAEGIPDTGRAPLEIGRVHHHNRTLHYKGLMDDVRVYSRVLSKSEVRELYKVTGAPRDQVRHPTVSSSPNQSVETWRSNMNKGLIGHYSFDRAEPRRVTDKSVTRKNGRPTGGRWISDGRTPRNGAYEFDGDDDHIDLGKKVELDESGTLSIAFWMKPYSWKGVMGIVCKKGGGNTIGFLVYREPFSGNKLSLRIAGKLNSVANLNSSSDVEIDVWQHWTAVYAVSEKRFTWYKNGKEEKTHAGVEIGDTANTDSLEIGRATAWPGYFHGLLDDVMIWNRALSETEVQQLYKATGGK